MKATRGVWGLLAAVTLLTGCPDFSTQAVQNLRPHASAGLDQSVDGGEQVTLVGSADDDDGDPVTVRWSQVGGSPVALSDPNALEVTFEAPTQSQTLVFSLTANDGFEDGEPSLVHIVVRYNRAPVADPGGPYTVANGSTVTLDASASLDPDGDLIRGYAWAIEAGPPGSDLAAVLLGAEAQNPILAPDLPGQYSLSLVVSDGALESAKAYAVVDSTNRPPDVDAGEDQTVVNHQSVALTASATDLELDEILEWRWAVISGPAPTHELIGSQSQNATFIPHDKGLYVLEAYASDASGESLGSQVSILSTNNPPTVEAGAPLSVKNGAPLALSAVAQDADQDVLTLEWSVAGGPVGGEFELGTGPTPTFTPKTKGTWQLQVSASDGDAVVADVVEVTSTNNAPTAVLGPDIVTGPAGGEVFIPTAGTSDPDGDPLTYVWRQLSGPALTVMPAGPNPTVVTAESLQPVTLGLRVDDGEAVSDEVTITLTMDNLVPQLTRVSPEPVITIARQASTASVTGTDPEGQPVTYLWRQLSGPVVSTSNDGLGTLSWDAPAYDPTGEAMRFEVRASDGQSVSLPLTITVMNTPNDEDFLFVVGNAGGVGTRADPASCPQDVMASALSTGRSIVVASLAGCAINATISVSMYGRFESTNWTRTAAQTVTPTAMPRTPTFVISGTAGPVTFDGFLVDHLVGGNVNCGGPTLIGILVRAPDVTLSDNLFTVLGTNARFPCLMTAVDVSAGDGTFTFVDNVIDPPYRVESDRMRIRDANGVLIANNHLIIRTRPTIPNDITQKLPARGNVLVFGGGASDVEIRDNIFEVQGTGGGSAIVLSPTTAGCTGAFPGGGAYGAVPASAVNIQNNFLHLGSVDAIGLRVHEFSYLNVSFNTISGFPGAVGDKTGILFDPLDCQPCTNCVAQATIDGNILKTFSTVVSEVDGTNAAAAEPVLTRNVLYDAYGAGCLYSEAENPCVTALASLNGGLDGQPDSSGNLGAECISGFVDAASAGSVYTLAADSPCLDLLDCADAPATDIDGDARPQGARCDPGADEYSGP